MSHFRQLRTQNGRPIALGRELGKGGEGTVYEVGGNPALAAKIYHPDKAAERQQKIEAIVAAQWHKTASCVAFPIDALFSNSGRFTGFTMAQIGGNKPIHDLYSPTSRKTCFPKASFPFLIRTALNIARALAKVHATGCVIGDINHSGILISENAIATLIDCDSFQVTVAAKTFLCKVGVPDFTPPELQGKRLDQFGRTANHDAFGLAVVLFNLLFMGRHPFAGRFLGRGDMPLETAIAQYRFAYSSRKRETQTEPPPNVPVLADVPQELANAFEIAFGQVGAARGRPSALDWLNILKRSEIDIRQCTSSHAHQYFRTAPSCPWCRMESAYPGFLAFAPPIVSVTTPTPISLGQLIAAIRAVPDPGTAPELVATMPPFQGSPSQSVAKDAKKSIGEYVGALLCAIVFIVLMRLQAPAPALGLVALAGSIYLALRKSDSVKRAQTVISQSALAWKDIETKWNQCKNNDLFSEVRREAHAFISKLQNLGNEENRRISDLKVKQEDTQKIQFLQQFYIAKAKIKGIGRNRKIMLRSYGIETAADVQQHSIQQINGFGPVIAGSLIAWRTSIERRFVFKPNQPLNSADVAAVKAAILKERSEIETKLRQSLSRLQVSNETRTVRNSLQAAAVQIWKARKQAELDTPRFSGFSVRARLAGVGAAMFFSFILLNAIESPSSPAQAARRMEVGSVPAAPQAESIPDVAPGDRTQRGPSPSLKIPSKQAPAAAPEQLKRRPIDPQGSPPGESATSSTSLATSPPSKETVVEIEKPTQAERPLDRPMEIKPVPQQSPPIIGRELKETSLGTEALTREHGLRIQTRLRDLGFLPSSNLSGAWDAETRGALRDFKIVNRLSNDDVWDRQTREMLNSQMAVRANQSFIGTWCGEKKEPRLSINSHQAKSAAGGICRFSNFESTTNEWRVRGDCTDRNQTWTANIRLIVRGNKLVWSGERGSASYFRCN